VRFLRSGARNAARVQRPRNPGMPLAEAAPGIRLLDPGYFYLPARLVPRQYHRCRSAGSGSLLTALTATGKKTNAVVSAAHE
jgi:hypothetical protein